MFTVRATKKLLDRCGVPSATEVRTTTVLGDWYATAMFWRPQVALFVNEPTRLPVLVPLAPAASVVSRFVDDAARVFAGLGLDPRFVDAEVTEMSAHCLGKTASRSVIGTMNDFAFMAKVHRDQGDAEDLIGLALWLAHTPCGPLQASTGFPDLEVRAIVERVPGLFGNQV